MKTIKLLALMLSLVMVFVSLPVYAFSDNNYSKITPEEETTVPADDETDNYPFCYELTDRRTSNTKTVRMPDGSVSVISYPYNVHYLVDGQYKEIDNTIMSKN